MQTIPSKEQWKKWSLPSKLTAIGTLVGMLSFGAYILEKGLSLATYNDIGIENKENIVSDTPEPFEVGELNENENNVLNIKKKYAYNLSSISGNDVSNKSKSNYLSQIRSNISDLESIEDKNLRLVYQVEKYRYTGDAYRALAENIENPQVRKENALKAKENYQHSLDIIKVIRNNRMYNETSIKNNAWLDEIVAEDTLIFFTLIALAFTERSDDVKCEILKGIEELKKINSPILHEYNYKQHYAFKDWIFVSK